MCRTCSESGVGVGNRLRPLLLGESRQLPRFYRCNRSSSMFKDYLSLVRFSHTVFALPFAGLSAVWAIAMPVVNFSGDSTSVQRLLGRFLGILLCMVAARSAAMAFNRLVDQKFDAGNPRTANRHLPRGILSRVQVWSFFWLCCLFFVMYWYSYCATHHLLTGVGDGA